MRRPLDHKRGPLPLVRWLLAGLAIVGCSGDLEHARSTEAYLAPGRALALQPIAGGLDKPVDIQPAPDRADILYVAEQTGRIRAVDLATNTVVPAVVLDLSDRVHPEAGQDGKQVGLLAFTLHPNWPADDRIFTNLVDPTNTNLILEHHASDPAKSRILLSIPDAEPWHNAGQVLFGPDGMLYIGIGDGCAGGCDCKGTAQNIASLRGKILRIDVTRDVTGGEAPYTIPADNPQLPGMAPEVWLWGVRNPWRISFDRATGDLYFGDVGDKVFEEVNVFPASGQGNRNFGWPILEGAACLSAGEASQCGGGDCTGAMKRFAMPIVTYNHTPEPDKDTLGGCAVIGGHVYRGTAMPDLQGAYLYADHCNGWLRSIHRDESQPQLDYTLLEGMHPSTFGQDLAGELYVTDYWPGKLYRIGPGDAPTNRPRYTMLSETGFVTGGAPSPDVHGFEPAFPLWSDGARKERWLWLPPDTQIDSSDMDHWQFPVGTKVWKDFAVDGKRIETRMIERYGGGPRDYWMGAFVWNDDGDATFQPGGDKDSRGTAHDVPAAGTCITCHGGEPGRILGVSAIQLSGSKGGVDLRWLVDNGKLTNPPAPAANFAPPGDEAASAALGYLHANCGGCHNPHGSGALVSQVLRSYVDEAGGAVEDTRIFRTTVGQELTAWHVPEAAARIAPGNPDASGLFLRMTRRGAGQMPPIATEIVDPRGEALLRTWIGSLR